MLQFFLLIHKESYLLMESYCMYFQHLLVGVILPKVASALLGLIWQDLFCTYFFTCYNSYTDRKKRDQYVLQTISHLSTLNSCFD